jgi:hypothetical protein
VDLKAGALLVREWKGQLERVMILEEGFAWNGQTFGSLSQIAKAMTGTTGTATASSAFIKARLPRQMWARIAERAEMEPPSLNRMARRLETRRHEGSDDQMQLAWRHLYEGFDRPWT